MMKKISINWKIIFQNHTRSRRKRDYFFEEKRTVKACLAEDIHFDGYDEIRKIKLNTRKYKQLYTS
jgi:hypothetical protein